MIFCPSWFHRAVQAGLTLALLMLAAVAVAAPAETLAPLAQPSAGCASSEFAQEVLRRINQIRSRGAVCGRRGAFAAMSPLAWSHELEAGASAFAAEMATQRYFGHSSPNGSTLVDRLRASGYRFRVAAENIANGQQSLDEALEGWMHSEGHCANIMNGALRDVGMACAANQNDPESPYWALLLGASK